MSFLKGGLIYASHLTTVSATYAREITTPELGCGLEGLLRQRSNASELTGILNGIDESWDPRACASLAPVRPRRLGGQAANADYVRKQFGLALSRGRFRPGRPAGSPEGHRPRAIGGRRDHRGRRTDYRHRQRRTRDRTGLVEAHRRRPDAIGVVIGFNDGQARRIFAGSDFTLMPSRFEPCGLSQMYAQRFGSLPIGHQTGGLAETIEDGETGFLFSQPSAESFLGGVRRAFDTFRTKDRLELDAPQRDVAIVQLGSFGGALQHALSQDGGVVGFRPFQALSFTLPISRQSVATERNPRSRKARREARRRTEICAGGVTFQPINRNSGDAHNCQHCLAPP